MSVNFHKWYQPSDDTPGGHNMATTSYHANQTVSKPGYAMIDRGANGCIIGHNTCLISNKDHHIVTHPQHPRYVNNVTGINNHQIQQNMIRPIATCGVTSLFSF
eukprot:jgi/Psemu1/16438/gm1.16438_g